MTRERRWNTLSVLVHIQLLLALIAIATAYDIDRITPLADRNIRTGNKTLYEEKINESATELEVADDVVAASQSPVKSVDAEGQVDVLEVNEMPVRYDEAQLWRIYNISNNMRLQMMPVADVLENKYGGTVWKENSKFLDVSIEKKNLKAARTFLQAHNLEPEILNSNIQDLIDLEQIMGANMTQSEVSHRTKRATDSGIHWKDYHDLDVIYSFMLEIRNKFPKICRLYTIGKTAEGRDLKVLRISENARNYKKIWIDGGIHAREWISPATVTYILNQLMSNWAEQPDYIRKKTWYIMPVLNPDGYVYSRKENRLWRKNRSPSERSSCLGVDLNRNFNIGWKGYGSSNNPCTDTYRGTSEGSELETDAVVKFLTKRKHNLESYLTFHSYGQMMVYPWAYKADKVEDASALQHVANTAVQRIKKKTRSFYRASVTYELLGIAGGGSDDWARDALGTKYVYTIELRDRGTYGFVLPPNQILQTALEGFIVVDTVAKAIK